MGTHNICFCGELTKNILELSSVPLSIILTFNGHKAATFVFMSVAEAFHKQERLTLLQ